MRGDREGETHVHAARIPFHRRVDELGDLGEGDDLVELAADLGAAHAEDGAVEEDVLAARELGMEAGADLEQRGDAAAQAGAAGGGLGDAGKDLEERGLARAVAADDADDLAGRDIERDVAEGPELGLVRRGPAAEAVLEPGEFLAQGSGADAAEMVALGEVADLDDGAAHTTSMKFFSTRWNTSTPLTKANSVAARETAMRLGLT